MCHLMHFVFGSGWVFGEGRSNCAILGSLESKIAAGGHFEKKVQMSISQQCIIRFTLCMYTDHILLLDTIMTVDTYDRRLDTYFARKVN